MTRKPISKSLRFDVLNRDGFRCQYCGADGRIAELHIDHRTPVALGGSNEINNLITACVPCNLGKRTKIVNLDDGLPWEGISCPFADGWPNDIEDPVYFMNELWAITEFGIERLDKFYAIELDTISCCSPNPNEERLSNWLLHLSTKVWVASKIDATIEVFARALSHFDIRPRFDWEASVIEARRRAGHVVSSQRPISRMRVRLTNFDEDDDGEVA